MSSALTSGSPPPRSVASVRAICEVANFFATCPTIGRPSRRWSSRARCPGRRTQPPNATTVTTEHGVEIAASLAGEERRRVNARKQISVSRERVGQRGSRSHFFVNVIEHATEGGRDDATLQELERLDERHSGFEQCRELLVE